MFYATGMDLFTFAELKFKPGIVLVERSDSGLRACAMLVMSSASRVIVKKIEK